MDVLTQLEQACDHGAVLLSETFAVALRPADPAFIGDGVAPRAPAPAASAVNDPPAAPSSGDGARWTPLAAAPATLLLGPAILRGGGSIGTRTYFKDANERVATEKGLVPPEPVRLALSLAAAPLDPRRSGGGSVRRAVTVRRLGVRRAPSYPDDTSAPADFYFSSPSAPYPGGALLTSLDGDASGVISGVGLDGGGPPGASGALGVAQSSVFDLVPSNEINFVGAFGLCMSPSGLEVPLSARSRRKNGLWEPNSGQNSEGLVPFSLAPFRADHVPVGRSRTARRWACLLLGAAL